MTNHFDFKCFQVMSKRRIFEIVDVGGMAMRVAAVETKGVSGCPCKKCVFDKLLRRLEGGCSPRVCRRYVRCMAHEREDGRSVYFEEV